MRRSTSRLPAGLLPGAVLLLFAVVGLKAAGVGLFPHTGLFRQLGLASEWHPIKYCSPKPYLVKTPALSSTRGSWRAEPDLPVRMAEQSSATIRGLIYLLGGQNNLGQSGRHVYTFNPATRTYGRIPDMPVAVDHTIPIVYRGDLYVAGGYSQTKPVAVLMRYSPAERRWAVLKAPPSKRGGAAGGLVGHRLYVIGGAPTSTPNERVRPYHTLEIYDFRNGRWSRGPDMPTARHHLAAAAAGGRIYAAGGRTPTDLGSQAFEQYDTRTRRWTRLPGLPLGLAAAGFLSHGSGLILVAGGDDEGPNGQGGYVTAATLEYDARRGRWSRLPDMPRAQQGASYAIADGRLWSFGGMDCPGFHPTSNAYSLALSGN